MSDIDQDHVNAIAKMYAEQTLALSMQVAEAIIKSALTNSSLMTNEAQKIAEVINIEAIRKSAKEVKR